MNSANELNATLVILLVTLIAAALLAWVSPDALDALARNMRARGRAVRVSREYYRIAYDDSIREDLRTDRERRELERSFDAECQRVLDKLERGQ